MMGRVLIAALGLVAATAASPAAAQTDHVLVISGVSGEPRFAEAFHRWATTFIDAVRDRHGVPAENIVYLAERPERDAARIHGRSDRAGIEAAFQRLAQQAGPEDRVLIVLFGHGSEQDGEPRLNIPGPDLTASDFARLIGTLRAREVALVHTGSASGGWIGKLSAPGRVILTATRSGFEQNETIFPEHFVAAYAGDGADTDKDGRISLLEAFVYATQEVERTYKQRNLLQSEHALLDDDGDGKGSPVPDPDAGDGALARAFVLAGTAARAAAAATPELRALYETRQRLERQIEALRARRASMDPAAYEAELERLLVQLAETNQQIRRLEGERQP
ncbi:MAG: hypothetical protein DIU52_005800 [bacterium]|jgi:hypothetical protein